MATLSATALYETSLLARCIATWAQRAKGGAPRRQAMAIRINAACLRYQTLMLRRAWHAWSEWAVQRKLHYWALQRADGRYRQSVLMVALEAWKTGVDAIILRRRVVCMALQHWRIRSIRSCMHGWHAWAAHACWEQCAPPPPSFTSVNLKREKQHLWRVCRHVMGKAVLHRLKQLRIGGIEAFRRNAARRKWERAELVAAQKMHESMLMDICTRHLTTLWQSKLQLDIGRRTKALADGLQLAAPYAMHWLLKTRHRLQSFKAEAVFREVGQENRSGNCLSTRPDAAEGLGLQQHKQGGPSLSVRSFSSHGNVPSHGSMGQRRKVRSGLQALSLIHI